MSSDNRTPQSSKQHLNEVDAPTASVFDHSQLSNIKQKEQFISVDSDELDLLSMKQERNRIKDNATIASPISIVCNLKKIEEIGSANQHYHDPLEDTNNSVAKRTKKQSIGSMDHHTTPQKTSSQNMSSQGYGNDDMMIDQLRGLDNLNADDSNVSKSNINGNLSRDVSRETSIANFKAYELGLMKKFNAVYEIDGVDYQFSKKSLFCMDQESAFRYFFVRIVVNKWFDRFVTLCIILNSIMLASKENDLNYDKSFESTLNNVLEQIDIVFSAIFLAECVCKIIAMGFVTSKKSYLRDWWNVLDFFIVLVSLVSFFPGGNQSSLKAFRTARILRPLRSIRKLKSMRILITSFIASIPGVLNVCIFMGFMFTIFAIVGVQFFVGKQYQFCRATDEISQNSLGQPFWEISEDAPWQCSSDEMCRGSPNYLDSGEVAKCGDVYRDHGLDPLVYDGALENETINYDITNFNSVIKAGITIFQVITLEGWSQLMYNYQDTVSYATSSIYFVAIVILGSFTSLNLVLAAIMHSFLTQEEILRNQAKEEKQKLLDAQEASNAVFPQAVDIAKESEVKPNILQLPLSHVIIQNDLAQLSVIEENQQDVASKAEDSQEAQPIDVKSSNRTQEDFVAGKSGSEEQFRLTQANLDVKGNTQHLPVLEEQTADKQAGIRELQERERRVEINGVNSMLSNSSRDQNSYRGASQLGQERDQSPQIPSDRTGNQMLIEDGIMSADRNNNSIEIDQFQIKVSSVTPRLPADDKDTTNRVFTDQSSADLMALSNTEVAIKFQNVVEQRAQINSVYYFFFTIVMSVTFNFLIYCFILGNTITLALYRYDQSDEQADFLKICDVIFVWVFTAEMFAKLLGLGVRNYVRDQFNVFDGIIVVIGLVDFALSSSINMDSAAGIMSALRALRLLRVVKLARHWQAFQQILKKMIASLIDISSFSVLLLLFMYIAALLGMEMFAFSAFYDIDGELVFGKENIQAAFDEDQVMNWPRENFNDIWQSLVTVFIVIIAEDWNAVMYLYVRAYGYESSGGRPLAIFFFITLFVVGNTIMMALFTALLLKNFKKDLGELKEKMKEREMRETHELLKDDEECDGEQGGNPCRACCSAFCNSALWKQKYEKFAERFIEVFGGKYALIKHQKSKRQKDPKGSASPISGNAILPFSQPTSNAVQPATISIVEGGKAADIFNSLELNEKETIEDGVAISQRISQRIGDSQEQVSSFASPDKVDTQNNPLLQRPSALLHYDQDQVFNVKNRKQAPTRISTLYGRSLYLFGGNSFLRKGCHAISTHKLFDAIIITLIIFSTCTLAFEHPLEDPNSEQMKILEKIDLAMTTIFCLEAILKIVSHGFILNGRKSYLRDGWNMLDFFIVALSVVSLSVDANLSFIKVLRVARILRPLRLIQKAQGLKIAIQSLFKALPQIMSLQIVVMFVIFMISILLTTLLSGKFFSCDLSHTPLSYRQQDNLITNKWDCVNYGGIWATKPLNFDDTLRGMLTLFIFQSREGWVGLMWDSVDAVDVDQAPVMDTSPFFIILYMVLVIILGLLFVNMFVGIVIETYNLEKDYINLNQLLSKEQRSWIEVQIMTYDMVPKRLIKPEDGISLRNICLSVTQSRHFENFIMVCIMLNTIVMGLLWFDEPEELPETLEYFNYIFMTIFTIEAVIKIIALRKAYFSDSWNKFDFTIVILTLLILGLKIFQIPVQFGAGPTVLRALRIGRILRLIKQAQQLQIIFHTLLDSAVSLGSLGLLLVILFFMFAIIGRSMFGMSSINEPLSELNEHVNFRDFWTSFLLLMRCSTGESWHMIMFDLARTYSPEYQCRENETYETMMENGGEPFACGNPIVSYIFFVLFHILVFQIFVNLFIAIIIDAFLGQTLQFQLPIKKYSLYEFCNIWSKYDPEATGYIDIDDLDSFLKDMSESSEGREIVVLADKVQNSHAFRQQLISKLNIPTYNQVKQVMFYDVLQQLCDKINLVKFTDKGLEKKSKEQNVLAKFGLGKGGTGGDIDLIFAKDNKAGIDFERTIRNMGRLNSKVKLIRYLQEQFTRIHDQYAIYVDNESNLLLSDLQRRNLSSEELTKLNKQGQLSQDDMNLYTTKHVYAVKTIIRQWRARIKPNLQRKSTRNLSRLISQASMELPAVNIQDCYKTSAADGQQSNMQPMQASNQSFMPTTAAKPQDIEEDKLDLSLLSKDMKSNVESDGQH